MLIRMAAGLALLITPGSIVLAIYSETLFGFVFGPEWREAGRYALLLIPLLAVRFATLPSWTGLIGRGKPQLMLLWTALHFLGTTAAMFAVVPSGSPLNVVLAFSVAGAITHLALLGMNRFATWLELRRPANEHHAGTLSTNAISDSAAARLRGGQPLPPAERCVA